MPRRPPLPLLRFLLLPTLPILAQNAGNTSLTLEVGPEARLDPSELTFRVWDPVGSMGVVTAQSATVTAWIRTNPGRHIRLTAALKNLRGPAGPVPATSVRWTASRVTATGGGKQAICSSGAFTAGGAEHDLVQNLGSSGMLTCTLTFLLALPPGSAPGWYDGDILMSILAP